MNTVDELREGIKKGNRRRVLPQGAMRVQKNTILVLFCIFFSENRY